jgi:hypothetical protein
MKRFSQTHVLAGETMSRLGPDDNGHGEGKRKAKQRAKALSVGRKQV